MTRGRRLHTGLNYLILTVFAVLTAAPLVGVISSALTPPKEASASFSFPSSIRFDNFVEAWQQGHFDTYLRSSLIVTVTTVVLAGILSILAGYAFGTMRFRFSEPLFYLLLLGMMVPTEAIIVPLYYDMRGLGLTDTYWSLILPQTAQSLGFGVFWMRSFFRALPPSLLEAARIDGATRWTALWRVLVPVSRPALLTMTMLIFLWTWNEFLLPLVMIANEDLRTAPLALAFFQGEHTTNFALLSAASLIVALPVVILFVFLQRHFIAGMLSGAIKE